MTISPRLTAFADGIRPLWASTVIETAWMSPTIDPDRPEHNFLRYAETSISSMPSVACSVAGQPPPITSGSDYRQSHARAALSFRWKQSRCRLPGVSSPALGSPARSRQSCFSRLRFPRWHRRLHEQYRFASALPPSCPLRGPCARVQSYWEEGPDTHLSALPLSKE